jgi:hypothetical protein
MAQKTHRYVYYLAWRVQTVNFRSAFWKKAKQSRYTPWWRTGERKYSSYSFLTSALDGGEWSASRPGRAFTPGERTLGTHRTGGWVGPRAGLDTEARGKILCPCRGSNPNRTVVQSVVRHYTDWATQALSAFWISVIIFILTQFVLPGLNQSWCSCVTVLTRKLIWKRKRKVI